MLPGQGGAPLPFPLWPGMGLEPPIVSETSQLPQVAPSSPGPPGPKDLGSISLCDFLMVIHFTSSQRGEGQVCCSPSSEVETGDNDTLSAASGPPAPAPPPQWCLTLHYPHSPSDAISWISPCPGGPSPGGTGGGALSLLPPATPLLLQQDLGQEPGPWGSSELASLSQFLLRKVRIRMLEFGSSLCGSGRLGSMRMQVRSLASLTGLGIWHGCELWCRWQIQLGSRVAVAVV